MLVKEGHAADHVLAEADALSEADDRLRGRYAKRKQVNMNAKILNESDERKRSLPNRSRYPPSLNGTTTATYRGTRRLYLTSAICFRTERVDPTWNRTSQLRRRDGDAAVQTYRIDAVVLELHADGEKAKDIAVPEVDKTGVEVKEGRRTEPPGGEKRSRFLVSFVRTRERFVELRLRTYSLGRGEGGESSRESTERVASTAIFVCGK